ncbi:hypothetical protein ACFXO9_19705 [Nocardia tengchongensis]|uniref:hypothetical protein n=1 Tax=Nocardia tengchongensis TaxID=2055889 RepID=UPI00368474E6
MVGVLREGVRPHHGEDLTFDEYPGTQLDSILSVGSDTVAAIQIDCRAGVLMTDRFVSPLASGGAGFEFEYGVATLMFSRMLRGAHLPVGGELRLSRIALQQRNAGCPFDDIVAFTESAESGNCIQIQVKMNLWPTARDPDFIEVMRAASAVCRDRWPEVADGSLRLGLAASGPTAGLKSLAKLTKRARAHTDSGSFAALFQPMITKAPLRDRYEHVKAAVATAAAITQIDEIEKRTHQILAALHIWEVGADSDDRDWRTELDALQSITADSGTTPAALLRLLRGLAENYGPHSGEIDADHLRAVLRHAHDIRLRVPGVVKDHHPVPGLVLHNNGSGPVYMSHNTAHRDQIFNGTIFRF